MTRSPKPIGCAQAVEHLYELLDHELTPDLEARVRAHFEECKRCYPLYRFESGFKRFLAARTETRRAPDELRRKIFEQIMFEDPPDE